MCHLSPSFIQHIPGDPLLLARVSFKITGIWGWGKNLEIIFKVRIQNKTGKENIFLKSIQLVIDWIYGLIVLKDKNTKFCFMTWKCFVKIYLAVLMTFSSNTMKHTHPIKINLKKTGACIHSVHTQLITLIYVIQSQMMHKNGKGVKLLLVFSNR